MGSNYLTDPIVFLIRILFDLYIVVVMLRFLLQLFKADFYNPISQFAVKATAPLINPLRRFIPGIAGLDMSAIVLMVVIKSVELLLILAITGKGFLPLAAIAIAIPELFELAINFFLYGILIQVILSWVNPGGHNPAISLIHSITAPLLRPAARMIPPIGGLDLSPMVVMVGLQLLKMLLIPPLNALMTNLFI